MSRWGQRPRAAATPPAHGERSQFSGLWLAVLLITAALIVVSILDTPTREALLETFRPSSSTPAPSPSASRLEPLGEFATFEQPPLPDWLPETTIEELEPATSFPEELTQHPLFKAEYPVADCPDIQTFDDHEQFRHYTATLADCMLQAWRPHFATLGLELEPVQVIAFTGQISTPCGLESDWYQVFYCPENKAIYLSSKSFAHVSQFPTDAATTTIHETFHHIQHQSGISPLTDRLPRNDGEITRRKELQTICSESRQALTLNIGFTEADYEHHILPEGRTDSPSHGSNDSYSYWSNRGFHVTTMQGCNTWIVPADMVD